jgi:hypothetical protein
MPIDLNLYSYSFDMMVPSIIKTNPASLWNVTVSQIILIENTKTITKATGINA